ncbi:hypothetical protein SISSUDRAFT_819927 [Sistotremastrum suecicum HHB10207 ss-3]|uniref:Tat pathway signal sequence n=1 Tax=Sistotremastrum suecicum HHB10207 ss-3 TaxID=1314776 RepID=A0A166CT43_9AGAM|nr:hypothetical protein SISSUDRAFT_819927 [Sistotremastrum suecicum HHB10207 ss-3]
MPFNYERLVANETSPGNNDRDIEKWKEPYDENRRYIRVSPFRRKIEIAAFAILLSLNLFLAFKLSSLPSPPTHDPESDPIWGVSEPLYSPAQGAVKYERRVFDVLGTVTKYHGPPTDETDEAWDNLYMIGLSRINEVEASQIANWTERIPNDEDHFIISLDVFHQLHCLNHIRRALSPERYGPQMHTAPIIPGGPPFDHVDHCLNILRESVVCNADITPNVFQWNEEKKQIFPHFDSVHTCRNWESIMEWARGRKLLETFDKFRRPDRLHED